MVVHNMHRILIGDVVNIMVSRAQKSKEIQRSTFSQPICRDDRYSKKTLHMKSIKMGAL